MHVKPPVRVTRRGLPKIVEACIRRHLPAAEAEAADAARTGRDATWSLCHPRSGLIAEATRRGITE